VPNFVAIGQIVAEIWWFFIFQDGGCHHLGFLKFQIFNGQNAQEGQTVSPCHISWHTKWLFMCWHAHCFWTDQHWCSNQSHNCDH